MPDPDSGKYGVWHGDSRNRHSPADFLLYAHEETAVTTGMAKRKNDARPFVNLFQGRITVRHLM